MASQTAHSPSALALFLGERLILLGRDDATTGFSSYVSIFLCKSPRIFRVIWSYLVAYSGGIFGNAGRFFASPLVPPVRLARFGKVKKVEGALVPDLQRSQTTRSTKYNTVRFFHINC